MKNLAETIPEIHTTWFVGKKLVKVTGADPYIRYEFEGGGYSNNTSVLAN